MHNASSFTMKQEPLWHIDNCLFFFFFFPWQRGTLSKLLHNMQGIKLWQRNQSQLRKSTSCTMKQQQPWHEDNCLFPWQRGKLSIAKTSYAKHQIVKQSTIRDSTSCIMKQQTAFTWGPTVISHDRGTMCAKEHDVIQYCTLVLHLQWSSKPPLHGDQRSFPMIEAHCHPWH